MKIVIAGAGSVGRAVALELLDHGHEVTLIDKKPDQLRVASVADAEWVLADACSPEALSEAGLREADVVLAATGDDKANLVISLLAKTEFAIPRVVARLNNPKNEWLFNASWGVDVPVSTPRIMTALVEEAISVGTPVKLFAFNSAQAAMYAFVLPENSPIIGKSIADVAFPPRVVLSAILRDGEPFAPQADDQYESGDELVFLISARGGQVLDALTQMVTVPLD
ncbi:MAG: TrkA family potassium uptake protein [Actinomyces sp.]|jgi:trk-type K+ transport system, NAD-binding component|uniref:potassium channel family protein n=1 Tax=Actinomyces sp. TaxID=29317 RepID=UPI001CB5FEF6|nr:TrkA family potassium uptake protein [Actinomyces sp.]MBF0948886.1 TrkA family potassium uptake protein [Actinomyces sp.]MDU1431470.1 TrkA family potassium uptake protein [Actinomyces sp.]